MEDMRQHPQGMQYLTIQQVGVEQKEGTAESRPLERLETMSRDRPTKVFTTEEKSLSKGELPPGTPAGEYILDGLIAQGGCGAVYVAKHRTLPGCAAVKVLHSALASSPRMIERTIALICSSLKL